MRTLLAVLLISLSYQVLAQDPIKPTFVSIFNGKDLTGWKVTEENPESFSVEGGVLIVKGPRAHLFYDGPVGDADFKNFELKLKVKTKAGANSGVYFHTLYQKSGWPRVGFEAQVNSTQTDPRKTGSLYGVANIWVPKEMKDPFLVKVDKKGEVFIPREAAPSKDDEWFDYHIIVVDKTITLKVNGETLIVWTQPTNWAMDRRIGQGTVGLQAHDPGSEVHYKDIQLKILD